MKDCYNPGKKKSMVGRLWSWMIGTVIGIILIVAVVQTFIKEIEQ